jgi:hypothetical protein
MPLCGLHPQQPALLLGKLRQLLGIGIDDEAATGLGTTSARLGDVGHERVVVGDFLADGDVAERDPPRDAGLAVVIPLRGDLTVRVTRVIEPARLADEVPEVVLAEPGLFSVEDQGIGIVEIIGLAIEDAIAVSDDFTLLERPRRDDAIAMNLGVDDLESIEQRHGA